MIDEVTLYIFKSWGLFMFVLLIAGELLVLLIDWVFRKWKDRKNDKMV